MKPQPCCCEAAVPHPQTHLNILACGISDWLKIQAFVDYIIKNLCNRTVVFISGLEAASFRQC